MLKKTIFLFLLATAISIKSTAQDTFSICAVDTITGEVGSAGASCIDASAIAGGVVIISDVHPNKGVIHTQSYWVAANQNYGRDLMNLGLAPQQILDSLTKYDAGADSTVRQYGIVDLYNGGARSAAYTGNNCLNYKNHIIGTNYAIQGNILLGQHILDSMEARFLNTPGDLACKLMAAMQGAKVVGADTRCTPSGNSSLSSFLRVACPGDVGTNYKLNLIVPQGPVGFEPIDSLQTLFNAAHNCSTPLNCNTGIKKEVYENSGITVLPNPSAGKFYLDYKNHVVSGIEVLNVIGERVLLAETYSTEINLEKNPSGIYFLKISTENFVLTKKLVKIF